ncbi:hypothetical protein COX47_01380, partial [Candidatus Roizmanbacteria bacterium CG23_combo_of_CG06-09_8_20_14_all_35_49]
SFQNFKKIVRPVKDLIENVNLWGFGEPFLAPDIMRMIDYAGENNIFVTIHTNANALNKKIMDRFRKNYRARISFSIDGLTQKTYGYYRRGGNLKKVLDNLSYLVGIKKKYNLYRTEIVWQFLINNRNEREVPYVKEAAKKIGVDRLRLKTINASKKYKEFIPKNEKYQREKDDKIKAKKCGFIDPGIPTVLWNGDVVVCCQDYKKDNIMGNVFKENLSDIWDSDRYQKFRKDYKEGINDFCNTKCKFTKKSKIYLKEFNFSK